MVNIKSPLIFVVIGIVVILAIISVFGVSYYLNEVVPPKVVNATAKFSGEKGEMIIVQWFTDKPVKKALSANEAYLAIEGTNKTLGSMNVEWMGNLLSKNAGKTTGFFVADNGDFEIVNVTKVTIVLGDQKFENYTMIYNGK